MSDSTLPLGQADPTERREARREKVHRSPRQQDQPSSAHFTSLALCLCSSADWAAAPVLALASDKMADDRGEETVSGRFPPIPIAHQDVSRAGDVQCEVIPNLYLDTKMCVAAKVYKSVTQTVVACNHISTPSASDCMMSQGVQSSIWAEETHGSTRRISSQPLLYCCLQLKVEPKLYRRSD